MASNMPSPWSGGLSRYSDRNVDRAVQRYEREGYVAMQRELIDLQCSAQLAASKMMVTCGLVDMARGLAGSDPLKQEMCLSDLQIFHTTSSIRAATRLGGGK